MNAELSESLRTKSGTLVLLPVRPQILDRVEFRRVGREELQPKPSPLLAHKIPHRAAAMAWQPVPDDQQLAGDMAQQMRKKQDNLRTADSSRKQSEVEVPPGHSGHR